MGAQGTDDQRGAGGRERFLGGRGPAERSLNEKRRR